MKRRLGTKNVKKLTMSAALLVTLAIAATAQAVDGGKIVTPPTAGLAAGLSSDLLFLLKRFQDCIVAVSAGRTPPGSTPSDHTPNNCSPEWLDGFEGLVWEGRTPAAAKLTLDQIAIEAGGYAARDQVSKYGVGEGFYPKAVRDALARIR
jgi:hypothetical protein